MQWHSAARSGCIESVFCTLYLIAALLLCCYIHLCRCAVIVSQGAVALVIVMCCFSTVVSAMPAGGRAHCWCWFSQYAAGLGAKAAVIMAGWPL
jgi:hypothetical protein